MFFCKEVPQTLQHQFGENGYPRVFRQTGRKRRNIFPASGACGRVIAAQRGNPDGSPSTPPLPSDISQHRRRFETAGVPQTLQHPLQVRFIIG